jgi:modulator of FtsH protease
VSAAYNVEQWSDLFVAAAGATGALAGLVAVAVSINLDRILQFPGLPERALTTVLMLVAPLIVALLGLAPGQSDTALGIEFLVIGAGTTVWFSGMARTSVASDGEPSHFRSALGMALFATVPFLVGGIAVLTSSIGGLYWILAGICTAIVAAVLNAWVLLVEILR